jgi:hypothetical protein
MWPNNSFSESFMGVLKLILVNIVASGCLNRKSLIKSYILPWSLSTICVLILFVNSYWFSNSAKFPILLDVNSEWKIKESSSINFQLFNTFLTNSLASSSVIFYSLAILITSESM